MNAFNSLTDELMSQLQGAPLQQLARQLGTDTGQAEQAVGAALPMLLGKLGQNATQPGGAAALFGALERDHAAGGGLEDLLGSVLGGGLGGALGGGAPAAQQLNADGILGHIFGGSQPQAEASLGQATGIGGAGASNLLKILAPIVMSFLAQRVQSQGMDAGSLGSTLGQERDMFRQQGGAGGGLLGSLLDQDGDGQVDLGDLIKIGGTLFGGKR